MSKKGKLRERLKNFTLTDAERETEQFNEQAQLRGSLRIATQTRGKCNHILGKVVSVIIPPLERERESQALQKLEGFTATISDGYDTLDLVFVGRRMVLGILPGAILEVEGYLMEKRSVNSQDGEGSRKIIFNPRYSLIPQ